MRPDPPGGAGGFSFPLGAAWHLQASFHVAKSKNISSFAVHWVQLLALGLGDPHRSERASAVREVGDLDRASAAVIGDRSDLFHDSYAVTNVADDSRHPTLVSMRTTDVPP